MQSDVINELYSVTFYILWQPPSAIQISIVQIYYLTFSDDNGSQAYLPPGYREDR